MHAACCILLGLLLYTHVLNGPFLWDDTALVQYNPLIRDWSHLGRIFSSDIGSGFAVRYNGYRPLSVMSYLIDYTHGGPSPYFFHLTNIFLHILVAVEIFYLVRLSSKDTRTAAVASLIFIVHPVHTQAVAYISNRAELLSAAFFIAAFISYLKALKTQNTRLSIVTVFLYLCAALSKENALILPLLLAVYHFSLRIPVKKRLFLSVWAGSVFYLVLRLRLLSSFSLDPVYPTRIIHRIPGFFAAVTGYIRLLIFPVNLHMDYGNAYFSPAHPAVVLGAAAALTIAGIAVSGRKTRPWLTLGLLWFLVMLLPYSSIYPGHAFYMTEHWLYLPSIGFALIAARFITRSCQNRPAKIIFFALIITCSCMTVRQTFYWKDPVVFFRRNLAFRPQSPRLHNNLGVVYASRGNARQALRLFRRTLELKPSHTSARINLALTYCSLGRTQEALRLIEEALPHCPHINTGKYYYTLGIIYRRRKEKEKAQAAFAEAFRLNPALEQSIHGESGMTDPLQIRQ
ncbi:MAG: tetratricopeptide repeat protein [Candidatus Omnitrophica bacterium]|nr:tetratricopeptide repeat protein [Candidatus Omnitrophota bacterium]